MRHIYKLALLSMMGLTLSIRSSNGFVAYEVIAVGGNASSSSGTFRYDGPIAQGADYGAIRETSVNTLPATGPNILADVDLQLAAEDAGRLVKTSPDGAGGTAGRFAGDKDYGHWVPVPEPATIISGLLLLLPFGACTLRILRRRQTA